MRYLPSEILDKETIMFNIKSENKEKIIPSLLSLFMNKIDKKLAIKYSNWAMKSDDFDIKKMGIIGMGHISRVYGLKDTSVFKKNIEEIEKTNNPELLAILSDAKDDFNIFIK